MIDQSPAWIALQKHLPSIAPMRDLFEGDPKRFTRFSVQAGDLFLDYSKNKITSQTMDLLLTLAQEADLEAGIAAMFSGQPINTTENRAVLHTALRQERSAEVWVENKNIVRDVHRVLDQMETFVTAVRSGQWLGFTGQPIRQVVNIGIGGSDLGPKMVTQALDFYRQKDLHFHFVSNIDATHLARVLDQIQPETTLFIIASKTFTTQETLTNAHSARAWFLAQGASEADIARHFVALSTNEPAVKTFGIDPANMFVFWDWVGGRYSLWSCIGLPIALAIGMENFHQLLAGARQMDEHFCTTPFARNIPVILALLGIWYRNFHGHTAHAVLPYEQYLELLPAYLQQADMESNGKGVTKSGQPVTWATGPIVWGEPGTNGQHAFYQLLHQGSSVVPCDFLAGAKPLHALGEHHAILLANFLAQTEALMKGRTLTEAQAALRHLSPQEREALAVHKVFPGNRPSNSLIYPRLTPHVLGQILAMYEHKIFVQGWIWGINSFDQMGVELGKELASTLLSELGSGQSTAHDSSTAGLLAYCLDLRRS